MTGFLAVFEWIESTPLSVAVRESTFVYLGLITVHVLSVFFSAGTIIALDLRLLGWGLKKFPLSMVFEQLRPWTLAAFAVNLASGSLLFWSEPVTMARKPAFFIKMASLAILGLNALLFDRRVYPTLAAAGHAVALPQRAQVAGGVSLFLWGVVIFTGRWSAY